MLKSSLNLFSLTNFTAICMCGVSQTKYIISQILLTYQYSAVSLKCLKTSFTGCPMYEVCTALNYYVQHWPMCT